jgi:ATP-dependent Clp protease ATP-binding subunit ClpA
MQETTQDFALSAAVKQVVKIARAIAKENGHAAFAPAHLLKALLHEDAGLLPLLKTLGQSIPFLDEWADVRIESLPKAAAFQSMIAGSASAVSAMDEADVIRIKLGREAIEPLHLLAALSTPGVGFTYEQLKSFPLRREDLLARRAADDEMRAVLDGHPTPAPDGQKPKSAGHALVKYCIDKTLLARAGKLDNIVGRDREVRMMAEILCRRSKPNVLLVGEPGVGKSALADGFALAILREQVPPPLGGARVFELDSGALVAGASYKGEVEERLKNIIHEIKQFDRAILFIDELHTLLDKHGAAAGSANLLKPQLARGELTVIGATTLEEYRKYIEPDRAFSRRFEVLPVEEPPAETCFHMIKAVIPYYEQHHHLAVPDEAIHESIRYAKRYVKDRKLPDAAIDLLDCTLAALQLSNEGGRKNATEATGKYTDWCRDEPVRPRSLEEWRWFYQQLRQQVSPVLWARVQPEGEPAEMTRVDALKEYLHRVLEALRVATLTPRTSLENTDLAAMIANKTGIPTGQAADAGKGTAPGNGIQAQTAGSRTRPRHSSPVGGRDRIKGRFEQTRPADWLVLFSGTHGYGQNRTGQIAGGVPFPGRIGHHPF